jgi:hypothetical protein
MSSIMNTSARNVSSTYTPSDVIDRHNYAVQKNRKTASTGGGRAWSEEEVCHTAPLCYTSLKSDEFDRKSISFRPGFRKCHISTLPPI